MAQLNPESPFQSWILTEVELLHGHIFTQLQTQALQNYCAQLAIERINLPWLPENFQREAELKGAISTIQYLLEVSKANQQIVAEEAQNQPD